MARKLKIFKTLSSTKSDKPRDVKIMTRVSAPLMCYLSLYSSAYGISKYSIFKRIFDEWVMRHSQTNSEINLVDRIVEHIKSKWNLEKTINKNASIDDFKALVISELKEKGVEQKHINDIIFKFTRNGTYNK